MDKRGPIPPVWTVCCFSGRDPPAYSLSSSLFLGIGIYVEGTSRSKFFFAFFLGILVRKHHFFEMCYSRKALVGIAVLVHMIFIASRGVAQNAGETERFRKLDSRSFGVLRAWRTDLGEAYSIAGPGNVVTVETKDFVEWVVAQVNILGIYSDPIIDAAPPGVREIIKNRAFTRAVALADALKSGVRGDAGDLLFLMGKSGFLEYATALQAPVVANPQSNQTELADSSGDAAIQAAFSRINGHQYPAAKVLPLLLQTSTFKGFVAFLPEGEKERLSVVEAVDAAKYQLWRQARSNLRPKIADIVFEDNPPLNADHATVPGRQPRGPNGAVYEWYRFRLDENDKNSAVWSELRRAGLLARPVKLTLVSKFGERRQEVNTAIDNVGSQEQDRLSPFFLEITSKSWVALAIFAFGLILGIFICLAWRTDLLCDTNGGIRGDGFRPYSLARAQMAFWFLVIVGTSLFLWIATGQLHVLNETCLWLIGIGSGTALGSAVIAEGEQSANVQGGERLLRRRGEKREDFAIRLNSEIAAVTTALANAVDPAERDRLKRRELNLLAQRDELSSLPASRFHRVLEDWLTDKRVYSFHRYQMLVWTIVLGMVFITKVWKYRELPTFDGAMLALMGITSGTYLGFKLQGTQK